MKNTEQATEPDHTVDGTHDVAQTLEPVQDALNDAASRDWRSEYMREVAQSRRYRRRAQEAEAQARDLAQHDSSVASATDGRTEVDERVTELETMLRRTVGQSELINALRSHGVGEGSASGANALDQASALLADRIAVDISGPTPRTYVLDEDGEPLTGKDGGAVYVSKFVSQWLTKEAPHFLPPSRDTGSGAHAGSTVSVALASLSELDRNPRAKADFIARFGPQAYVQLAHSNRQR